jgi:hypothetical protein
MRPKRQRIETATPRPMPKAWRRKRSCDRVAMPKHLRDKPRMAHLRGGGERLGVSPEAVRAKAIRKGLAPPGGR